MITGQCQCKPSFTGRACDRCDSGFGNVTAGCKECKCGLGSKSEICDPFTGECECQTGTIPPYCNDCQDLHFGLSSDGCQGKGFTLKFLLRELYKHHLLGVYRLAANFSLDKKILEDMPWR